jgi:glutathione S-transferase
MNNTIFIKSGVSKPAQVLAAIIKYKQITHTKDMPAMDDGILLKHHDIVIYDLPIAMEYLDEIIPSPPIYPIYPAARAIARTLVAALLDGRVKPNQIPARPWLGSEQLTAVDIVAGKYYHHQEAALAAALSSPIDTIGDII